VTATTAELNILDGVTATTAELNILDGATVTTAEINQLDGNSFTADVLPDADSTRDLGSSTKAWAEAHVDTVISTNVSDGTLSIPTTYVTNGSAKAWVNFNGTGTIAARDSLNVSSLTDNGTGDYTVNFTNAFGAADYMSACNTDANASGNTNPYASGAFNSGILVGSFRVFSFQANSSSPVVGYDITTIMASCHGDLA
jgi:hypothetical protein